LDPSRCPEGKAVLWLQIPDAPRVIKGDAAGKIETAPEWTEAMREAFADRIEDILLQIIVELLAGDLLDDQGLRDAIVRVRIGATVNVGVNDIRRWLESIPVHDYTIERARIVTSRRRATDISAGMGLGEALDEWLGQTPEFAPMKEELLAEALALEVEEL
ncbi:hypothetical protein LCGC14_2580190, partial [marine sediment metagenome]